MISIETCQSKKVPLWLKITATAAGLLLIAIAMGRLLTGGGLARMVTQVAVGALMVYVAGLEKKMSIDGEGIIVETSVWRQRRLKRIGWDSLDEAKLTSKDGMLYLTVHAAGKARTLLFAKEQAERVETVVRDKVPAEKIRSEI